LSETTATEQVIIDPGEITFRRLTYGDLPAVLSIERRSFPAPWSLAMFVLEVSKPAGVCLAAISGGEIVGYLVCSRYADVLHLMNVAVDPDRRRLGIAARMVERMLAEAGRDERYTLEVRVSNHGAIAMYEKLGFRRAGRRRRYYSDNGEDAMIMWLGEPGL
jgi:[ribosomal protein S18]-alanine N-acetyltransferase